MKNISLIFFALLTHFSFSQKIQILDKNTNQAIPFANVRTADNKFGISSDIDGYINLNKNHKSLIISHINYQTQQIETPFPTKVYLIPKQNDLLEIIVNNVNPAIKIIKKAVENRELHNPKNLHSFTHYAYSRLYIDMELATGDYTKLKKHEPLIKLNSQHLFMSESRTKHEFLKPNYEQETLLSHKTSGIKNPLFASALTDFQPFTLYDELINLKIMRKTYLNPISKNAWKKYDFELIDTLLNDLDSTFVIAFEPKLHTTFDGFKGFLHINSDGYAIENINLEPISINSILNIKMQQRYERVEKKWFPKQQNTEILVANLGTKNTNVKYSHKTYLSDIEINSALKESVFSTINKIIIPKSYIKDETFWNKYRSDSLSPKEIKTYQFYDSLSPKVLNKIDNIFNVSELLLSGYIPFRSFKIPIGSLIHQNVYENTRLGFGLRSGDSFSKRIAFEGYIGYGFRDNALKYGILGQFFLKKPTTFFQISYRQDLIEPATIDEGNQNINITDLSYRNFVSSRMDSLKQIKIQFQSQISRNGRIQLGFSHELRNPTYQYQFSKSEAFADNYYFQNSSLNIGFRWAWGEKYAQIGNTIYQSEKPTKVLQIYVEKGIKGIFNSEFDFTKLNFRFQKRFVSKNLGTTDYLFTLTKVWGDTPYSYLANGLGSSDKIGHLMIPNVFQTMGLYEFTSDQQVTLFIKQNFGRLIPSKSAFFQPEFILSQGISYGSLQNPNFHRLNDMKNLEKGYLESGLSINKLLRIKYINAIYLDFGIGAFARYGANALPATKDNLVFKWLFGVSF